jgi:hypothetical protein
MKKLLGIGVALVLVLSLAGSALASTTVYTNRTAWETAVGTWATEDFDDGTVDPPVSVVSDNGYVTGGLWWDQVDDSAGYDTTWTFANPIIAWGGTFDAYNPGGPGSSINVTYIDGTSVFVGTIPNSINGTFWGFVSDEPFIQVHLEDAALLLGVETYEMDDMVYSFSPQVEVDKVWTMTNVCFEVDNDGDGELSEDWQDGLDNDGDDLIDEDPDECAVTHTGTVIEELEALLKGNGRIHTVTPGQFYAMSNVTISTPVDELVIEEDWGDCCDMLELNPKKGGGQVIVVYWNGADWEQIYDAEDPEVAVNATIGTAEVTLTDVEAGTYLVLVKFSPKPLKGEDFAEQKCTNENSATATIGTYEESDSATATLTVVERVPE